MCKSRSFLATKKKNFEYHFSAYVRLHRKIDLGRPTFAHWKALFMVGSCGPLQLPLHYICILKGNIKQKSISIYINIKVSNIDVINVNIKSISNQKFYLFSAIRHISSFLQNKMCNVLILLCFLWELKWTATLLIDTDENFQFSYVMGK